MLAVNAAALVALATAPAVAQPPNYPPGTPSGYAPGTQPGYPPAGGQFQQPGSLPYPPGYRPRALPAPPQASGPAAAPGGGNGGNIMYFQKPADASTATGGSDFASDGTAQVGNPPAEPSPGVVPDVTPYVPPPPPSRYLSADRSAAVPPTFAVAPAGATATAYRPPQDPPPMPPAGGDMPPSTSMKPEAGGYKDPPGDPRDFLLPSRKRVFDAQKNDAQLEQSIMQQIKNDLIAAKNWQPNQEQYLKFPPLPILSPPGVPYQSKTASYEPSQVVLEPGYVIHRKLYFEERNGERAGWDLGPFSTLVATSHFYIDTFLFPAHLIAGCQAGYWDTSSGKCLPGSPTPYYLYSPELTAGGSAFEAGVITGLSFLFP